MSVPSATDRAALQALFQALATAWSHNDAQAYGALFEQDADYVVFDGTHIKGRERNVAVHTQLLSTLLRGTRLEGEVEHMRMLSADVALVHTLGAVLYPWQRKAAGRQSRQTLVCVRHGDAFRIAAFQNTRLKPLPPLRPDGWFVALFLLYARLRTALAGRAWCT